VAFGARTSADLQQMRASGLVQSLLESHSFGHVSEQIPLQQSSPLDVLQSDETSQAFGHFS
jgi:hypothetical protein